MKTHAEQVFVEALSLPVEARAQLAQKLLASLEQDEDTAEIEAAWQSEAAERCKAYDEGKLAEREGADVLRDAYKKIE